VPLALPVMTTMLNEINKWSQMVKIEHTLFSLPFVLSSSLLAIIYLGYDYENWQNFIWIMLALFSARSSGMTLNRLIDSKIDAKNPRTADREIPKGDISKTTAWIFTMLSILLLIVSALQLPTICIKLFPIAFIWLVTYSFLKRFTWLCHFFLGTTLGGATYAGWIAITGTSFSLDGRFLWIPIYFALAVSFWVSGFDIYYALQDEDFDRNEKLHSVPSEFGAQKAKMIARFCHFLTPIFLYLTASALNLGISFKVGIVAVIACLIYEQKLVEENKIEKAFFTINTWISVLILFFVVLEFYLGVRDF
jgi:4-hydroxybenzoate polyprenyltransferase